MAKGKKTGGRVAGTPNKSTTAVKTALIDAFERLGGVTALVDWGKSEPTEFYKLWAKVMPTQVNEVVVTDSTIKRIEIVPVVNDKD